MLIAKLGVFFAALTLSLSAHAGFVQYNFSGTTLSDGGALSGYFVQNTDDRAIVYFDLNVTGGALGAYQFFPSGLMSNILSASTHFDGEGPTNFSVFNDQDVVYHWLNVQFSASHDAEQFRVYGSTGTDARFPEFASGSRHITAGFVIAGVVGPDLLAALEEGPYPSINYIVPQLVADPNRIPEPGSMALCALGLAAVFARSVGRKQGA